MHRDDSCPHESWQSVTPARGTLSPVPQHSCGCKALGARTWDKACGGRGCSPQMSREAKQKWRNVSPQTQTHRPRGHDPSPRWEGRQSGCRNAVLRLVGPRHRCVRGSGFCRTLRGTALGRAPVLPLRPTPPVGAVEGAPGGPGACAEDAQSVGTSAHLSLSLGGFQKGPSEGSGLKLQPREGLDTDCSRGTRVTGAAPFFVTVRHGGGSAVKKPEGTGEGLSPQLTQRALARPAPTPAPPSPSPNRPRASAAATGNSPPLESAGLSAAPQTSRTRGGHSANDGGGAELTTELF